MAKEKNSRILDKVQGALLDDRDFLREIIENFCQRLLEEEMAYHLQAESYQRTKEEVWLSQRVQIKETENPSRNLRTPCSSGQEKENFNRNFLPDRKRSEKALVASLMQNVH